MRVIGTLLGIVFGILVTILLHELIINCYPVADSCIVSGDFSNVTSIFTSIRTTDPLLLFMLFLGALVGSIIGSHYIRI